MLCAVLDCLVERAGLRRRLAFTQMAIHHERATGIAQRTSLNWSCPRDLGSTTGSTRCRCEWRYSFYFLLSASFGRRSTFYRLSKFKQQRGRSYRVYFYDHCPLAPESASVRAERSAHCVHAAMRQTAPGGGVESMPQNYIFGSGQRLSDMRWRHSLLNFWADTALRNTRRHGMNVAAMCRVCLVRACVHRSGARV